MNRPPDLIQLEKDRLAWSLENFPEASAYSSLYKAQEEIREIMHDVERGIREPEEYADALMCLLDSSGRQGITVEEILQAYADKIEKNKACTWKKNDDNTYSHIKN